MNKSQKIKKATRKARNNNIKQWIKKIILFPWRVIKAIWRFLCRVCRAIWNWLKSIDIVGMINLTLLIVIIILCLSLITDIVCCHKRGCAKSTFARNEITSVTQNRHDNRKVVRRTFSGALPVKADSKTNIKPKIRTIGVKKPEIVTELSVPANKLPQQTLSGDVIVDTESNSPILSNGVKVNGNLFIQNMRKYTIPCGAKINGHLFIRNVERLSFCGAFTVNGNIYVNRESSFGPIPNGTKINGQIIL